MTTSVEARDALKALVEGAEVQVDPATVSELVALGLVAPVPAKGPPVPQGEDMETIRSHISKLAAEQDVLRAQMEAIATSTGDPPTKLMRRQPDYKRAQERFDEVEKDLRAIRTRYLGLVHAATARRAAGTLNGRPHTVTYRGQEVLQTLEQRASRLWTTDIRAFVEEVDAIRAYFGAHALRARTILKMISPAFKGTDEIHLRLASVGLAGRPGDPTDTARMFSRAYAELDRVAMAKDPAVITVAETAVLAARDEADLEAVLGRARGLVQAPWKGTYVKEDQMRAAAILLMCGPDLAGTIRRTVELTEEYCPGWPSAGALLACAEVNRDDDPGLFSRLRALREAIYSESAKALDMTVASALMAVSGQEVEPTLARYRAGLGALGRFNGGGMEVPAAMVAMLPYSVEEAMDNVRLAAAAIMAHKLSLGGAENLSLGVKMLMQSSVSASMAAQGPAKGPAGGPARDLVGGPAEGPSAVGLPGPRVMPTVPVSMAIAGLTTATAATMVVGLLAFHELTLHRFAVTDYAFHPVHVHHVYG